MRAETDPDLPEKYRKLLEDYQNLDAEYQKLKRQLEIKEIELKAVLTQAHEIANTDILTSLPNRRKVIIRLQEEVIRSNRYGTTLSISLLDVDFFKTINDTYGHATGDMALRSITSCLRAHIRHPDMIGRYGGEEFLIVLPNSNLNAASKQAERLCDQVRKLAIETKKGMLKLSISVGVAQFKVGEENWEQFLHRADTALYQAKNEGRDRWMTAGE